MSATIWRSKVKRENLTCILSIETNQSCLGFRLLLWLSRAPKQKFVIAILKSHKLKVIYFICSNFYYFFTAIYFTVFYEVPYILMLFRFASWDGNEKRREQPEDSQTINNFFNFIYQWIHISLVSAEHCARVIFTYISCCTFLCSTERTCGMGDRREMQFLVLRAEFIFRR